MTDLETTTVESSSPARPWAELLLIVLAVLPFQLVLLATTVHDNASSTGFILYDMPYYVANGREIFERGNGLMYPNPYDSSDDAPTIYFHWLLWVFGFCTVKLGIDPGLLFASFGLVGSLLMSWMTWKLVKSILRDHHWRKTLFLLTMWGGGLLCGAKVVVNAATGQVPWSDILAFDTHLGFWFLSWGRNTIFATEAIYHFLAISAWYFAFHKKYWRSVILAGLLAATHPWSGLEVLGTFTAFLGFRALIKHTQPAWRLAVTCAILLCAFFAYNLWYLNMYEAHRRVYEVWHINWSLSHITILLAYGPIGFLAMKAISNHISSGSSDSVSSPTEPRSPTEWQAFLITAFVCAFALATHDRFVEHAKQPLHFTRGFLWMPLCLLALPYLQKLMANRPRWNARPALAAMLLLTLASFDNIAFLASTTHLFATDPFDVQTLKATERDAFTWIEKEKRSGVLACSDNRLGYLSATYTPMNPYVGHKFITPDLIERRDQLTSWFQGKPDPTLNNVVDYVLTTHTEREVANFGAEWKSVYANDDYVLLEKQDTDEHVANK